MAKKPPVILPLWKAILELIVTTLLGWLGVHKLIKKKYGMFILYALTLGLLGIGWFVDFCKALMNLINSVYAKQGKLTGPVDPASASMLVLDPDAPLPVVKSSGLMMKAGEVCHYRGPAYGYKSKERVVGYEGGHQGVSLRVAKGVSYRVGQSKSQAVRATVEERFYGTLYITSQRVVFTSAQGAFDKPIDKLSSITPADDGLVFQFNDKLVPVLTADADYVQQIVERVYQSL